MRGMVGTADSVCSLPPCGGGVGRGVVRRDNDRATCEGIALPPPLTPPHKGEGNAPSLPRCHLAKAVPSWAKRHAVSWPNAAFSWSKTAFVTGQTSHRFAAGNLLRQRRASALDCAFVRRINGLSQAVQRPGEGSHGRVPRSTRQRRA